MATSVYGLSSIFGGGTLFSQEYFLNNTANRIVVRNDNLEPLTSQEIYDFQARSDVESVVENDYILDERVYLTKTFDGDDFNNSFLVMESDILKEVNMYKYGNIYIENPKVKVTHYYHLKVY
jgi:hypothetical protein